MSTDVSFLKVNGELVPNNMNVREDCRHRELIRDFFYGRQILMELPGELAAIEAENGDHYCWEGCGVDCRYRVN